MAHSKLCEDFLAVYHEMLGHPVRGLDLHETASVMEAVELSAYPDLIPGDGELVGLQHRRKGPGACRLVHRKLSMDKYSIFATPAPPRSPRDAMSATLRAWCRPFPPPSRRALSLAESSRAWRSRLAKLCLVRTRP